MTMMLAGLLLFTGTHLFLAIAATCIANMRRSMGVLPVKAAVAVLSLAGLALVVLGWRQTMPQWIYLPPTELRLVAVALIAAAMYLLVLSQRPSVLKRYLRHPQLTGVLLWAIGHLMLNGDSRSLLLFGGLALWAPLEMVLINARDGARTSLPDAPPVATDVITALVALLLIAALAWAHPWYTGVAILPR